MHAIIETGGKQYKVAEGDTLFIEMLPTEAGETVTFDKVLAILDEDKATFGAPVVEGAKVEASVVKNGKGKKVIVFKYKPKKNYRRKQGHRQPYTKVTIGKIPLCNDHRNVSYGGRPYCQLPCGGTQRIGRIGRGHPRCRGYQRGPADRVRRQRRAGAGSIGKGAYG